MDINSILYNASYITLYILVVIIVLWGLIYFILGRIKDHYAKKEQYNLTFLHIMLDPNNETEIEAAEHLFSNLAGIGRYGLEKLLKGQYRISFEIVSNAKGIGFYIVVPDELVSYVEKQINGSYPDAEINAIDPKEIWDRGAITRIAELKLKNVPYYPIKTYKEMENNDPLSSLTSALSKLKDDEVIAIQFLVSPAGLGWIHAGSAYSASIHAKASNPDKKVAIDTSITEGVDKKISKPGFETAIRIVSISGNANTANIHIRNVISAFDQFTNIKYNGFKRARIFNTKKLIDDFIYRRMRELTIKIPIANIYLYKRYAVLNTEELATVFHFPNKNIQTPNIMWIPAKKAAAQTNIPTAGTYLGINVFRGVEKPVYIMEKDRRRHMYIIGQTGTGKSVFMSSLALQDIYEGKGVAFIDPHGSEIDKLLEEIPEHRIDDVILFDASDTERPLGLNILEAHSEEEKHMIINSFIALLYKLYDPNRQGIMGPQLERAIRNVMLTAMSDEGSTLVDVLRMLIDEKYHKKFLPKVKDELVIRYWTDEVANTTQSRKGETMGYFVSKFDRFVTDLTMRNILAQKKSAFNFHDVMANRKILLVDLSKGKIGEENSNFLGLLLVPKILSAALSRAAILGKEEFPDFYLYVDEFQNFATPDFATILSEARKYKLNLTVGHQFVAQLPDEIKDAIFGNVGTMIVFRVGNEDAEFLETQFEPIFNATDLMNNSIGNAYIRLLIDGQPSRPFSLKVDWDKISKTPRNKEVADRIRHNSRMKYGTPIAEVEAYIKERSGFEEENKEKEKIPEVPKRLVPF